VSNTAQKRFTGSSNTSVSMMNCLLQGLVQTVLLHSLLYHSTPLTTHSLIQYPVCCHTCTIASITAGGCANDSRCGSRNGV